MEDFSIPSELYEIISSVLSYLKDLILGLFIVS